MYENSTKALMGFLEKSPTPFHVVANVRAILKEQGFEELSEGSSWNLKDNGKYFVVRNESSVLAFRLPKNNFKGFQIASAHTDSPCFKIKGDRPELEEGELYVKLNVEGYGGMLMAPWFDRPLSVAGRVVVSEECDEAGGQVRLSTKLVNIDRDLLMIPNLAIHMNRKANDGIAFNVQNDMLPLFSQTGSKGEFMELVADSAGVCKDNIVGSDLFLYSRTKPTFWGAKNEFFSAPHIDDLQCVYSALQALLASESKDSVPMLAAFDNEEVGSETKQGAGSTFLSDTISRIGEAFGKSVSEIAKLVASSMMVSADNAHAVHPNASSKADPINRPEMNRGIVIKHSANQKYTTDAVSAAMFKQICKRAEVPYQEFANRSDMAGGSTLGNISSAQVSLNTVDIGLAQLAMHSPYETAGSEDTDYLIKALKCFYETSVIFEGAGSYSLSF